MATSGGRIVEVGQVTAGGKKEFDAKGLVLAPGIIDPHTHFDAQITWDPTAQPSVGLGVTTVVMGNCGFTIVPCREKDRDLILRNLTQVEGMSLDALRQGTRWEFETLADYLGFLERRGVVPNIAVYSGHSAIRTYVMGADAARRAATPDEIERMKTVLRADMAAGAIGFSTSRHEGHNGDGGIPMPSRLAEWDELLELVSVLREARHGHSMMIKSGKDTIDRIEEWATVSGRPVFISALVHDPANPQRVFREMSQIAAAQDRGRRLYGMVHSLPISMDFTLTSAYPFELLASWNPAIPLYKDKAAVKRLYRDPTFRATVRKELDEGAMEREYSIDWSQMFVIKAAEARHRGHEGKTVAELAAAAGADPFEWFLDFGVEEDCETQFLVHVLNAEEKSVAKLLKDPYGAIALSDAGAHLTLLCDAGFALQVLSRWVRELRVFTLEEAIRKLTATPAAMFGIKERGLIAPGYWADLFLFDPKTVGVGGKRRVSDLPGGGARLTVDPMGVHGVWINGTHVVDERGYLGQVPNAGHVLREFAA
ncbi:MAG: amidohydrolase family protein [Alphaproteobacteria bacterium]